MASADSNDVGSLRQKLLAPEGGEVAEALDVVVRDKSAVATRLLVEFLGVAKVGLLTTRAALALETRADPAVAADVRALLETRPDLAADVIPILSATRDLPGVAVVLDQLAELLPGPARLSALAYLVKCAADRGRFLTRLLDAVAAARPSGEVERDIRWALEQVLPQADERTLEQVAGVAARHGKVTMDLVEKYLPAESALTREAPGIARALLADLVAHELIELVADSEAALVDVLARTICEARSPKALLRDVERILLDSPSVDEFFGEVDDLKAAFARVTGKS